MAASLQGLFTPIPEVLEFESWWHERDLKRYMLILYFHSSGTFKVLVDDSKTPLTVHPMTRTSEPVRAWNLHVGGTVDILGRTTTLMSATMRTVSWLDENAKRLWKMKTTLEAELNKFRAQPKTALDFGSFKHMADNKVCYGGKIDIGRIADCVAALEMELSQYQ